MESTQRRMFVVAVLVCGFAVGMAGLLNFFKYRSTALNIVKERLLVTGRSVENSVNSSLALGMQFGDIGTLQATLERERATDDLIEGIDVFDTDGRMLYSTDRLRANRPVPAAWLNTARKSGSVDWFVDEDRAAAAGMSIENSFGLTLGYLAVRFDADRVRDGAWAVGRDLALASLGVFAVAAALASVLLMRVMRGLGRDVDGVEAALRSGDASRASASAVRGHFGPALRKFFDTVRHAETEIADLQARLHRGSQP